MNSSKREHITPVWNGKKMSFERNCVKKSFKSALRNNSVFERMRTLFSRMKFGASLNCFSRGRKFLAFSFIDLNFCFFFFKKKESTKAIFTSLALIILSLSTTAQTDTLLDKETETDVGIFPKQITETLDGLRISGYYRFITNYRDMKEAYPSMQNNRRNIFVGDDAQIPQLSLNISGRVSKRTSFGTDLFMWTPMTGAGQAENVKGLNLGVNLYGSFNTDFGSFNVRAGGIHWYELSSFTFQTNRGYNRYSLFERNPWDPATKKVDSRYNDFFSKGALGQDRRWGMQAFQGLIVDGASLPHDFYGSFMYGKTQLSGGAQPNPNNVIAGKMVKNSRVIQWPLTPSTI